MNKQSMWFLTLFTLILVLSVYYITMPNELLITNNSKVEMDTVSKINDDKDKVNVTITESESVIAYQEELKDNRNKEIDELKSVMLDTSKTTDEKNEAFEQIKYLNEITGKEEQIEKKIKETYKIDSFVEIKNSTVKIVAAKKEHDMMLANKIMNTVQEEFDTKMYITVKFEN